MDLSNRLALSNAGGAVLFCRAGFSADCPNFEFDQQLGVSGALNKALSDLMDSCEWTGRLLLRQEMTHHPCHSLSLIVDFYRQHSPQFAQHVRAEALKRVLGLGDLAARRRGNLPAGSPNKEVDGALEAIHLLRAATPA